MLSHHNGLKLEISNIRKFEKVTNTWKFKQYILK